MPRSPATPASDDPARLVSAANACADSRPAEAERLYARALVRAPSDVEALVGHARVCLQLGKLAEAMGSLEAALARAPEEPRANLLFGKLALRLREPALAVQHFQRLLHAQPDSEAGRAALAHAFAAQGRAEEALRLVGGLIELNPHSELAWLTAGIVQEQLRRDEGAAEAYEAALEVAPRSPAARYHRAFLRLRAGDFAAGWRDYEARFDAGFVPRAPSQAPQWDGQDSGHLVVFAEQGFGDAIQFARFVPMAAARVKRLTLVAPAPLVDLFARSLGVTVIAAGAGLPRHDSHISLMSLPHALALGASCVSWSGPYLHAPASLPASLALPRNEGRRRVGLVWATSPAHPTEATPYTRRSCLLRDLAPLLDRADIDWFSLQIGPAAREIETADWQSRITDLSPRLGSFDATAAVVAQLDAVVSVDTAVAHLAGALGRPLHLLLPHAANWQWQRGEQTSWYPGAALHRQFHPGDWTGAVASVGVALREAVVAAPAPV
ncbi:tetratricopeptide repeat protein [Derxia gummosa]|uniref:Tetratricopeptide repeat protein n=1 Tax=Derxia gummosa DSM 723 TaxID=1121388 RepID=A0A8B6XA59_9BURK|nr:tetratricopeptide repeat protein [Derxia gummosa]